MRDLSYAEYVALQSEFETNPPKNPIAHRVIWDILLQEYAQEELLPMEAEQLRKFFDACEPADFADDTLHDYGAHRDLYNFITQVLRFDCKAGRGKAYSRAELLLKAHDKRRLS